jgi:tetratricopeptide (TPR) repeat protein
MVDVYILQGISLLNKRDFKKALESFRQAEHIATPTHVQVGYKMSTIRLWIAVCHAEQNNDNQAMYIVEEYRQMLSNEKELNLNRLNQEALQWLIHSFSRRAMDDQTRGQYQEAVSKFERCLQVQRMIVPDGHLDQGEMYHVIGDCFRMMSNWSYTLTNYRKALVIYEKFLPSNDPAILRIWLSIGTTQAVSGQYDAALGAFMKRQQLLLTVDSPNYSELADNYQLIATVFFNQGNLFDAVTNYQQSLDIYAKYSLPANFKTAEIWMTLGNIYASQKEYDDAVIALNTALEILIFTSAPMVQDLANIHEKLGVLHKRAKRYPEALFSFQNCLQNQRNFLPTDHLDLAETLSLIGEMNAELERFSDAAICYEDASQIQIKYLPMTTSKVITNLKNAACCYFRLLDWEKFFSLQEEILEFQLNSLPAGHLDIAQTYRRMGGVYYLIGNVEEALEHYLKCLDIQMNSLSTDHPLLLETRAEIDEISNVLKYRHK